MTGSERPRLAVAAWIALVALSAWQLARTPVIADLGAFLPPSATPTQELLLEQMKSGAASRVLLAALSGVPEERLAAASRSHAAELRASGLFA
jgi:predicted exporter